MSVIDRHAEVHLYRAIPYLLHNSIKMPSAVERNRKISVSQIHMRYG